MAVSSCGDSLPSSVRSRAFIAVVAFLVVLVAAAAGVAVLDSRSQQRIADGVRVGGVDVGGLKPAQARAKLQRELLTPLNTPIVVHHGSKTWTLSAEKARIHANVGAMVDEAMARSRESSMPVRAWRELTGGSVDASLPAKVSYERGAVRDLVSRVEKSINRDAQDADVKIDASGVQRVEGQTGLAVQAVRLEDEITATVTRPGAARRFVAHTRKIKPKVTTAQLESRYPAIIIVNRGAFKLTLYKDLKPSETYPIAVGKVGLETPAGLYHIQNKAINPAWTKPHSDWIPEGERGDVVPGGAAGNPLKARWLGIFNGAGIHGTDETYSLGHAASHGCIRMAIPDVIELYDQVPVGAPIYIA